MYCNQPGSYRLWRPPWGKEHLLPCPGYALAVPLLCSDLTWTNCTLDKSERTWEGGLTPGKGIGYATNIVPSWPWSVPLLAPGFFPCFPFPALFHWAVYQSWGSIEWVSGMWTRQCAAEGSSQAALYGVSPFPTAIKHAASPEHNLKQHSRPSGLGPKDAKYCAAFNLSCIIFLIQLPVL